ncbi:auxin-responsive IAA27-like [Olea europaea subsp. europaea]|uniref:Auxin-responsive protein n=1 Tax=Olea europaea subsp. europaea TaxID=158383 RepID=A0A8S0SFI7_OLEEU|nr:auxin-responsive IAA27-like [Olea europaea subsp. europaea]
MEKTPDKISSSSEKNEVLNLKETELRLGLPGSEFLDKKATGFSLFGKDLKDENNKNIFSGAKRVFSDAIDGSNKWGLCTNRGSEVDLGKNDVLFSPRGANGGVKNTNILQSSHPAKEVPPQPVEGKKDENGSTASKAQVVGWPPIRSLHKNRLTTNLSRNNDVKGKSESSCLYVKVSMDGAPYLRKVDLKTYCSYAELSSALEKMFSCFTIGQYASHGLRGKEDLNECHLMDLLDRSEYVLTYEDKDGDWMLVGDVPWEMFTDMCKRLRIMKGSEASGLAPRVIEKCKSQN